MKKETKEMLRIAAQNAKKEGVSSVQIVKEIVLAIEEVEEIPKREVMVEEPAESDELGLERKVTSVLRELGIPAHIKGYGYLRESIIYVIKKPSVLGAVTKELYPEIAEKHGTTDSRLERAIRHAIEVAWNRGNVDVLQRYFGYTIQPGKGKPTNSEFIAMIADYIKIS